MRKDSKTEKRRPLPAALLALGMLFTTSAADAATVTYVWRSPGTGKIVTQVVDVGTSTPTPTPTPTSPAPPDASETTLSVAYDVPAIIPVGSKISLKPAVKSSGGSIHYAVGGGPLPPGLRIDPSTGEISGPAVVAGTYAFGVVATDPSVVVGAYTTLKLIIG